ncbi:Zinc-finger associated domain (zf-AD) [Nesidiocoris tenuis]|uniref:Zinc-finger associated domain (Zf-AD) n=1 Tax=Nesidiocoris tenuis TaxID=355587 RepID=A0ABN7BHX5_9HEMI|nr:Zinc-finger associated domain (zf-AD) [Nesidiocoris tenuis]
MGSLDQACLTGFICRICCDLNKIVIHAFSDEADKIKLVHLMYDFLGVDVYLNDNLPKTVCLACAMKLRTHYEWVQMIRKVKKNIDRRRNSDSEEPNQKSEHS